jgi:hypothetical protein
MQMGCDLLHAGHETAGAGGCLPPAQAQRYGELSALRRVNHPLLAGSSKQRIPLR